MATEFLSRNQSDLEITFVMLNESLIKIRQIKGNANAIKLNKHCQEKIDLPGEMNCLWGGMIGTSVLFLAKHVCKK